MKQSPSEPDFHLVYCEKCIQMTNHLLGVCQKCKVESPSEEGKKCQDFCDWPNCTLIGCRQKEIDKASEEGKEPDHIIRSKILFKHLNGNSINNQEIRYSVYEAMKEYAESKLKDLEKSDQEALANQNELWNELLSKHGWRTDLIISELKSEFVIKRRT